MKLSPDFYNRPTLDVARDLIGKVLVRRRGSLQASGRIVETEAYIGQQDLACHASKGRTARTEVMFGPPGRAYVYMIYGTYHCLNAVTEGEGFPAAVLIRAIEPLEGLKWMRSNRPRADRLRDVGSGPGKLCQALEIDRQLNRVSLAGTVLWIEERPLEALSVQRTPRIGVDYAGVFKDRPWRFFARDNPHVSRHPLNRDARPAPENHNPLART